MKIDPAKLEGWLKTAQGLVSRGYLLAEATITLIEAYKKLREDVYRLVNENKFLRTEIDKLNAKLKQVTGAKK